MTMVQIPVDVAVEPWFADHRFNGTVVLPAVETMSLLAGAVAEAHAGLDVRVMEAVRFARFLEIPADSTRVAALVEYENLASGAVRARLLSRRRFKAVTRLQEHGEVLFVPVRADRSRAARFSPEIPTDYERTVPAEQVYRELVPFGPAYHTLQDTLYLGENEAWGRLRAPALRIPDKVRESIGSPFPLDGAFHAACVLGQRSADFVPFPVGFARRTVMRPTRPGASYLTRVRLLSRSRDELVFALDIFDDTGQGYESVTGVRMRDVSGGRIKPPEWIRERAGSW
jgi:hypothetical protein